MPDTKISALPAAAGLTDTDELLIASAGASKKITGAALKASLGTDGSPDESILVWEQIYEGVNETAVGTLPVVVAGEAGNDLMVTVIARGTNSSGHETLAVRFNGDTGANYYREGTTITGNATSAVVSENRAVSSLPLGSIPGQSDASDFFAMTELFIPSFSAARKKILRYTTLAYFNTNAGGSEYAAGGGLWNSLAAITGFEIFGTTTANLEIGSLVRVYGRS